MTTATAVHRERFRAMGTDALITVSGDGAAERAAAGRRMVEHLERCWSRFLPDSDITRLNLANGSTVAVDPTTVVLVRAMVQGWRATSGRFDPTLLAPLVALGYRASRDRPSLVTPSLPGACWRGDPAAIAIDGDASTVQLPPGTVLDPGAIGKGLAADLVTGALLDAGARGVLVDLGGDIATAGTAPGRGGAWLIGIEGARERVSLRTGAVATSGTQHRRWHGPDGQVHHHVLDPNRGAPVTSGPDGLTEVTVVARSAAWAEVWATAVLVDGLDGGLAALEAAGLAGRAVLNDGSRRATSRWAQLCSAVPA